MVGWLVGVGVRSVLVLMAVVVLWRLYQKCKYSTFSSQFPRSPSLPLIGGAHLVNPSYPAWTFHDLHMKLGKMYVFSIFGMEVLNVSDPEICDYIETHIEEFDRGAWPFDNHFASFGSEPLFSQGGKKWERRRKMLNHSFGPMAHKAFIFPIIVNRTKMMIKYLEQHQNTPIDLDQMNIQITLDIIFSYCFGLALEDNERLIISEALAEIINEVELINVIPWYKYMITPTRLRKWKKDAKLKNLIYKFIANCKPYSLAESLIEKGCTKQSIYDEVLGLLFAGHDTTGHTLTWCIYKIAQDPMIRGKVIEEIERLNQVRSFDVVDDLEFVSQFTYVKAVMNETLRFYPPTAQHPVVALKDTSFNGIPIKKGSYILSNQITVMRDPEYWDEPERYNPDRFLQNPPMRIPADKAHLHPAKFFKPFLLGPHVCLGKHLALSELQIIIPTIFKNFEIKLVDPKVVKPRQHFTLRPADPIFITVNKISNN